MLNMEVPVQLPAPVRRSSGLFLDVAVPLNLDSGGRDRLGAGVVHVPWGCETAHVGNAEVCMISGELAVSVDDSIITEATDPESKDAAINDLPDQVVHPPFKVVDGLRCGSMSFPNDISPTEGISNRLRTRMALTLSKMMMSELTSGLASGGPSLQDSSTDLGSGSIDVSIRAVESWLASVLHNGVGAVVIPPGLLYLAVDRGWVDPSSMRTVTGHQVISDAGFTGDPADPTSADPASFAIFGMALPGQAYGTPKILEIAGVEGHVDITTNLVEEIIESYAQIAFDPCTVGEATVTFA